MRLPKVAPLGMVSPCVPALLPKSGVVPGLCPRPHYLSASAYRYPRRIHAPALFGRCLRCRSSTIVVWSSLSALPCGMYVDKRLCFQAPRACTTDVVSSGCRPALFVGCRFSVISGQASTPRLRRSRQRCGGLRYATGEWCRPRKLGRIFFRLALWGGGRAWSPTAPTSVGITSVRCVLPLVVRSPFPHPSALAPTSVDSISHYIFYRAILYRTIDENVMQIKSTNVGYTPGSSCPLGALTHPPPCRLFCGGCFPYPPHPLGVFFIV